MDKTWKQMLISVLLGVLIPRILAGVGGGVTPLPRPTEDGAQPIPSVTVSQQEDAVLIPVELEDGNVQVMELERYIAGVVLAEMPASFEMEALKAQAVVARTYALRRVQLGDRHSGYAICADSTCCQAYISQADYLDGMGDAQDVEKISMAVQQTAGQVLTYNRKLAETTYFSCSGGRTEDAVAVWGEQIPYLQAVDSPGEESAEGYRHTVRFTADAFGNALGRHLEGNPKSWLGTATYTQGNGVDLLFVGGVAYSGVELRQRLALNSTAFTITYENGEFVVITKGKGHRVGMSQYGADAMASGGKSYTDILSYYYQGTRIDKNGAVG